MKSISIMRLTLRNFKGLREFTLDAANGNVDIFGDNAVGKTTIFDAFTWLLFDKDSENRKDFDIKTLDKAGNVLHGLEHEVEGVLLVDGRRVTLRKVYAEKYTKKRGSATDEFTGHSTDYFIDGVPSKLKEYKDRVDEIVQEDIFKLLTSPTFFNEQLKWQDRRSTLLQICGDISDDQVIESNASLKKLPDILNGRSIEDHRKVIAAKRTDINEEMKKIPVRIDEANRSIPDTNGLDEKTIQSEIPVLKQQIELKEGEAFRLRQGGQRSVKENQLREIEGELLKIKNSLQADSLDKITAKRQEISDLKGRRSELNQEISDLNHTVDSNNKRLNDYRTEKDDLLSKWHEVNADYFVVDHEHDHDTNCPTCGQVLPEDQIKAAHDKAVADFNLSKSEQLAGISVKGKAASSEIQRLEQENADLASRIETIKSQLETTQSGLEKAETELNTLQSGMTDVEADLAYISKQQEAEAVKRAIEQIRTSSQEALQKAQDELAVLKMQAAELEVNLAKFDQVQKTNKRIEELKQQEKTLAAEYERLGQELYLTEEFIRTKVNLLEEKINSKFRHARFKLFETQINGGLSEVCETTFNGVPYSSGLNNAARINVGLDIIATLSEHFGVSAPIFIDNRESVVSLIDVPSQIISLIVSAGDKALRVESTKHSMKEAV